MPPVKLWGIGETYVRIVKGRACPRTPVHTLFKCVAGYVRRFSLSVRPTTGWDRLAVAQPGPGELGSEDERWREARKHVSIRDIDGFHLLVQQNAPVRTRMYVCMYVCVHLRVSR